MSNARPQNFTSSIGAYLGSFMFIAAFRSTLDTLLAKRLGVRRETPDQEAIDWSAALNAVLMLPVGALLSLSLHPIVSRARFVSGSEVVVDWQRPTPSTAATHYMLGVVFCFLLSTWGAMYRPLPRFRLGSWRAACVTLTLLSVMLACISLLSQEVIYKNGRAWPAWVGLIAYITLLGCYRKASLPETIGNGRAGTFFPAERSMPMSIVGHLGDVGAVVFFFLVFWPYPFSALLDGWDLKNAHAISYLIGPALLSQVPGNLPNVNYFSQYSLGVPYIFSWALSSDIAQVVSRYLYGMTVGMVLFTALYYYLVSRLYSSRFWGFVFTLLMLVLLAHSIPWSEPSSSPLRFAFFPLCAIALLKYGLEKPRSAATGGLLSALAIINNTETGIHTALAFATVLFVASPSWKQFLQRSVLLLATTILGVVVMSMLLYGWGAVSLDFLIGNLRPLIVYSVVGYGNYPLPWDFKHWTWMQCLVVPGLATLLLALLYYKAWTNRALGRADQTLVFCSAFGLLLFVKFLYRSFLALGHVNGGPLIVVLGFWFVFALRKIIEVNRWRPDLVNVAAFALSLAAFLAFLYTFRENYPGADVGYHASWPKFPSVLNRMTDVVSGSQEAVPLSRQVTTMFSDADVHLIQTHSTESEPVWIYADEDWAYLLRAQRKPASTALPIVHILMERDLIAMKTKFDRAAAQYVFVQKKYENLLVSNHPLAMFPKFGEHYALFATGDNLDVYKRKTD